MTTKPLITLTIPTNEHPDALGGAEDVSSAQQSITIELNNGSNLFVVGPNGSGKSALMNLWSRSSDNNIKVIRAQRKNWMESSTVNILPQQRVDVDRNYSSSQRKVASRYTDYYADAMINTALFDLVESENLIGRKVLKAIDDHIPDVEEKFSKRNRPIHIISKILVRGLLNVKITIDEKQTVQATRDGKTYEVAQLSDGERNALILSCNILCSSAGTIFFIDEPEQHLHRSIASPLLSALISERPDCAFVIFTHELSLVETIEEAKVLVLHDCSWTGENPTAWDCNLLQPNEDIPNNVRRAILGGRKKILFVEGEDTSLDRRLYEVMYPDFTIHPAGSCSEVKQAVRGLKDSSNINWIEAYGIIDHDGRSEEDIQKLEKESIFALREFSVESLFYGESARNIIAKNKARELGKEVAELLHQAKENALSVLSNHRDRLAWRRCYFEIRQRAIREITKLEEISESHTNPIEISFPSPFTEELKRFQASMEKRDIDALIARYPVRETGLLDRIAKAFHYQTSNDYESAVVACVKNDEQFRQDLKSRLPAIGGGIG